MEDLTSARASGNAAIRDFFFRNFDVDLYANEIAIVNYAVPFDDMNQNHFLYQRPSDGKWLVAPWDFDRNFGGWKGAGASIYMGEQGNPDNRSGWWHRLKDAFLKAFRSEYELRLLELNNTILHPDNVLPILEEEAAKLDTAEANAAASGFSCSSSTTSFPQFRHPASCVDQLVDLDRQCERWYGLYSVCRRGGYFRRVGVAARSRSWGHVRVVERHGGRDADVRLC